MSRTFHKKKESNKRGAKAVSSHCANHGTCGWCQGNRHHKFERAAKQFQEDEFNAVAHENDEFDLEMEHNSDRYWCKQYDLESDCGESDWDQYQIHKGDPKIISYIEEYEKMSQDIMFSSTAKVPLWGVSKPDHKKCRIENDDLECGCGFGQCIKGLIY